MIYVRLKHKKNKKLKRFSRLKNLQKYKQYNVDIRVNLTISYITKIGIASARSVETCYAGYSSFARDMRQKTMLRLVHYGWPDGPLIVRRGCRVAT